jgi:hypothetical protein
MALFGLAKVSAAQGKISVARVQASSSLARFEAIGNARSAEVQAWLKALPPATSNGMH